MTNAAISASGAADDVDAELGQAGSVAAAGAHFVTDPSIAAPARIVAIGDLHSDINSARKAFQLAGVTDDKDEWIGGATTVVQTGDLIGRSDDERQVLDFIFEIRQKAELGGGRLYNLIGNHEVMGARVDNQAVGQNPFPGYEDVPDLNRSDPRVLGLAEYQRARGAALMAGGPHARRFAAFPTILRLGQTIFVHGGLVPRWAEYGVDRINFEVSQWFLGNTAEPSASLGVDDGDRPMWTRQFSSAVDATDCTAIEQTLAILGATRMVVAHTVQSTITAYCDAKVWVIDVGMSRYYGGPIEVLEILNDAAITVLR